MPFLQLNDVRLHFTDAANDAPALVFLHYFGGSALAWEPVIAELREQFRCIALDLRGFGDSDTPANRFSVTHYVEDLVALVKTLELRAFTLVGHSIGGKIALAYAARQPADLQSLVLLAPSPLSPEPIADDERQRAIESHGTREAAQQLLEKIVAHPLPPTLTARAIDDNLRSSGAAWRAWLEVGSREDLSALISRIQVPTLIVSGTADQTITPEVVRREVSARLTNAHMTLLPNVAHLLPLEAPRAVADLIRTKSYRIVE